MDVNIGIAEPARKEIASKLERLLADTYTLYLKSQNYHWNVEGTMFRSLHLMFEEHYVELRDAVDEIAERIRALGYVAPASYSAFGDLTQISDGTGTEDALTMVAELASGHETAARTARIVVAAAEEAGDVATADLATVRIDTHEKTAWMLRATAA